MENKNIKLVSGNVVKLSDIKAQPISRCSTGFEELDWIYGYSPWDDSFLWGMPQGKISLWSGKGGTGKSRLCIEVAKKWSRMFPDHKLLYILTESPLSDFASWVKDTSEYQNIHCSTVDQIADIIDVIYEVRPSLVFVDSVNEIEDFIGNAKSTRRLIKGIDNKPGLKKVVDDIGAHLVLLGQLNGDGSIKGGTSLPHAVDVALDIIPANTESADDFIVKVGTKNRHGKKNASTLFTHTDDGVINNCDNRLSDKTWLKTHGIAKRIEKVEKVYIPAKYCGQTYLGDNPNYGPNNEGFAQADGKYAPFWTVENQDYYLQIKAKAVAEGRVKLDSNGMIIPKKPKGSIYMNIGNFLDNLING